MTRRAPLKGGGRPLPGSKPCVCPYGWTSCPQERPDLPGLSTTWCKPSPETLQNMKAYCNNPPKNATPELINYLKVLCRPRPSGPLVGGGPLPIQLRRVPIRRMPPRPLSRTQMPKRPFLKKVTEPDPLCVTCIQAGRIANTPAQCPPQVSCSCPPPPNPESCRPFFPKQVTCVSQESQEAPAEEAPAEEAPAEEAPAEEAVAVEAPTEEAVAASSGAEEAQAGGSQRRSRRSKNKRKTRRSRKQRKIEVGRSGK